jgi:hypothetical protein
MGETKSLKVSQNTEPMTFRHNITPNLVDHL